MPLRQIASGKRSARLRASYPADMTIVLQQVVLYSATGSDPPLTLYDTDGSSRVCLNSGGWCGVTAADIPRGGTVTAAMKPVPVRLGPCEPTAARSHTWGRIKALYR